MTEFKGSKGRPFSAVDIAAAILVDLRNVDGSEKYLQITYGAQKLIDTFSGGAGCKKSDPALGVPDGQTLRSSLSPRVSGPESVHAFYNAVLAYDGRPDKPQRPRAQTDDVVKMAHLIIGSNRSVDIG